MLPEFAFSTSFAEWSTASEMRHSDERLSDKPHPFLLAIAIKAIGYLDQIHSVGILIKRPGAMPPAIFRIYQPKSSTPAGSAWRDAGAPTWVDPVAGGAAWC